MDTKIQNLINQNSENLYDWTKSINDFNEISFHSLSDEESLEPIYRLVDTFSKITELLIKYGKFRDNFEYEKFYINHYGPELIINSQKTKSTFYLGLDETGIYLKSHLRNNYNIRKMDDQFWVELLSLSNFGKFEFIENGGFDKKTEKEFPDIFSIKKSMIFSIFRRYFVDIITEKNNFQKYDVVEDFGEFKISWNNSFELDKIIQELCLTFKILYNLNYKLWKVEDLKEKEYKKNSANN